MSDISSLPSCHAVVVWLACGSLLLSEQECSVPQ
jgi:hypothetical protein